MILRKFLLLFFIVCILFSGKEILAQATSVAVKVDTAFCATGLGAITVIGVGGGTAPFEYSIDGVIFQTDTVFSNLNDNIYQITVKDANSLLFTSPILIVVPRLDPLATASVSSTPTSTCSSNDGTITVVTTTGLPKTFSLNLGTPTTDSVFVNLAAGIYSVQISVPSLGCVASLLTSISPPTGITGIDIPSELTLINSRCNANTGVISLLQNPANYFTNPFGLAITFDSFQLNNGPLQPTASFNNLPVGVNTITINYNGGCTYNISSLYVGPEPVHLYAIKLISDTCFKGVGQIRIVDSLAPGSNVPCTYSFDLITNFSQDTLFNQLARTTNFYVTDNVNGCKDLNVITIPSTQFPVITTIASPTICGLSTGQIVVNTSQNPVLSPYTITAGASNLVSISGVTIPNLAAGPYQVIVKDKAGCADTALAIVDQTNEITNIGVTVVEVVCAQNLGAITVNNVSGGTGPYRYAFNLQLQGNDNSRNDLLVGANSVSILDTNNCRYDTTITLQQSGIIPCNISASATQVSRGETVTLTSLGNNVTNTWTAPGETAILNNPFKPAPTVTTTYTLTTESLEGCEANCTITIEVLPKITLYKAFTPNGDGKNDMWEATNLDKYPEATIDIYSRWGMNVFTKKSGETFKGFDGKHNGNILPTGTYYYYIDLKQVGIADDLNIYKGFIEIIQ